jgi:hypothetical protein
VWAPDCGPRDIGKAQWTQGFGWENSENVPRESILRAITKMLHQLTEGPKITKFPELAVITGSGTLIHQEATISTHYCGCIKDITDENLNTANQALMEALRDLEGL